MPSFPAGKRLPACIALLAAWCSADTLDLPESSARGARAEVPAAGVHRIDGEALRRFATLEDALASLPGFRVRRQGGLGGYSELSFRGARASRVDVYVDGVRLNQDGAAAPDLSRWPSLWFSSLEARVGFDAAGAGPGSLARIDLSTRSAHRTEIRARGGSFAAGEVAAQMQSPPIRGWRWTLGVEGQSARNDYPFFWDNNTDHNKDDDATWRMANNAYQSRGARGAARRGDGEGAQSFSVLWLESRKEYPGIFPSSSRAYTLRSDWLGAWRLERFGGPVAWETGAQARRLWDSYRDPGQSLGHLSYEQARVSWSAEGDGRARVPLGSRFSVLGDARLRAEDIEPTATPFSQDMASPAAQRYEGQFGARLDARALPALSATLEARASRVRFDADGVRPFPSAPVGEPVSRTYAPVSLRAAAEWATGAGTFGAVIRREPRAPSSAELLGDNNGVRRNLDLRAEEARSVSLIHGLSGGGWSAQTSLYRNEYRDPVRLAAHGGSPFLRHENGSDYEALGAEIAARADKRFAEASLAMTLQDASIREGLDKGNRPAHQREVEAHAELFLKPLAGTRIGPLLDYRGPYYPGEANIPDSRRPAEWEWGAHAGAECGLLRLALDVRNLSDRQYRDFAYSPRSGRNWSLSLSLNL